MTPHGGSNGGPQHVAQSCVFRVGCLFSGCHDPFFPSCSGRAPRRIKAMLAAAWGPLSRGPLDLILKIQYIGATKMISSKSYLVPNGP